MFGFLNQHGSDTTYFLLQLQQRNIEKNIVIFPPCRGISLILVLGIGFGTPICLDIPAGLLTTLKHPFTVAYQSYHKLRMCLNISNISDQCNYGDRCQYFSVVHRNIVEKPQHQICILDERSLSQIQRSEPCDSKEPKSVSGPQHRKCKIQMKGKTTRVTSTEYYTYTVKSFCFILTPSRCEYITIRTKN